MTKKARQEIVSVVEYFNGVGEKVSPSIVREYISHLLDSSIDLPFHYQLKIDGFLRVEDMEGLLGYLVNVLNSTVFLIDNGRYRIRGFKHLAHHPRAHVLLDFLEDQTRVEEFIRKNYALHPLLIRTEVKKSEAGLVIKDFGNKALGVLGPLSMDFELVLGILNHLEL